MLNNFRNQLFGKQKGPGSLVYDVDTKWHRLVGPTGVWMTDLPIEQRQMEECIKGMKGRILVGGLGLGLAATLLAKKKQVKKVDVVEISQEVISLVGPYTHSRWNPKGRNRGRVIQIINRDLFTYLNEYKDQVYDYVFFDIWQSDSESTFHHMVAPLIALSRGKMKRPPVCWNEQVMRGQLAQSLQSRLLFFKPEVKEKLMDDKIHAYFDSHPLWEYQEGEGSGQIYWNWAVPFWKWHRDAKPEEERAQYMANTYAGIYAQWDWKDLWLSLI